MPQPYSYDLRCKVIEAIEMDGMPICEAVEVFHISRSTIHLWRRRKAETGDVQAQENPHPGHSHKITDWSKFREFMVIGHRNKTVLLRMEQKFVA
jgi:transposase